jgi:hypothetical protein
VTDEPDQHVEDLWEAVADAVERTKHPPSKVKTLADMTPEEVAELERQYGCPVRKKR